MGRRLGNGIVNKVLIKKNNNSNFDFLSNKDKLLETIGKYICLKHYDVEEGSDYIYLELKKEVFNNNIHSLIKEINNLTNTKTDFLNGYYYEIEKDLDVMDKSFNKDDYSFKLKEYDDSFNYHNEFERESKYGESYIELNGEEFKGTSKLYYFDNYWMFFKENDINREFKINIDFIGLWSQISKFFSENESEVLHILNTIKTSYYKTELSKDLIFFVFG